ncbi:DeoR/GlpR family DNA-binding transcription regulator [Christensenellaceae bacterium OttesenSCG-928-M15]|nr:DeoR/GlpR family DNA-binding transcription regulator [Christensenellaceae bacterium OttesenSCG-928-M15]
MEHPKDAETRRERILDMLMRNGSVRVAQLSRELETSNVTIRNDLNELANRRLLTRVHGGAVAKNKTYYYKAFVENDLLNADHKHEVARACAASIDDHDIVMMNSGSTVQLTLKYMRELKDITILTNSLVIAREAGFYDNMKIICIGGELDCANQYTYGDDAVAHLGHYHANKAILSVDGVSTAGIFTNKRTESAVCRHMMGSAEQTVVVADKSKIGRPAFTVINQLGAVTQLITNEGADEQMVSLLRESGVDVRLAQS